MDLRKSVDIVWRNGLKYMLLNNNINGNVKNILVNMNSNVYHAVYIDGGATEPYRPALE